MDERPRGSWARQRGESDRAFQAFRAYLDMGTRRSLRDLANQARSEGDRSGIATRRLATLRRWSVEHRWQERVAAWEDHVARQEEEEFSGENRRRARRMARLAEAHGEVLGRPAQELLQRLQANPDELQRLSLEDLLDIAIKAARAHPRIVESERLSRGMSTSAPAEPDPLERMDREQLDAYLTGVDDGREAERKAAREEG